MKMLNNQDAGAAVSFGWILHRPVFRMAMRCSVGACSRWSNQLCQQRFVERQVKSGWLPLHELQVDRHRLQMLVSGAAACLLLLNVDVMVGAPPLRCLNRP